MIDALQQARIAEKQQALFYRALSALAEDAGELETAERLHGLHADEQHHVSRLTVRLLELGASPLDLHGAAAPDASLRDWEAVAREREADEIRRYEALLPEAEDDASRALIQEIITTERHHAAELGGKWTPA